jgi:hypothetical protein
LPAVRAATVALVVLVAGTWRILLRSITRIWVVLRTIVGIALLISCTPAPAMALIVVVIVVVIIGVGILDAICIWDRRILDNRRGVKVLVLRNEGWVDILLPTWVDIHVSLGAE